MSQVVISRERRAHRSHSLTSEAHSQTNRSLEKTVGRLRTCLKEQDESRANNEQRKRFKDVQRTKGPIEESNNRGKCWRKSKAATQIGKGSRKFCLRSSSMWSIQRVMEQDQALAEGRRVSIQSAQHVERVADGIRSTCEEKRRFSAAWETCCPGPTNMNETMQSTNEEEHGRTC